MKCLLNPYQSLTGGQWISGNLHAHTNRSDGALSPQAAIDAYAALGHGFLMISDHDCFTDPNPFDARGMVLIPGNEISANGTHLLHVNARAAVEPYPQRQRAITAAVAEGGFIIVNHPNWRALFDHCPMAQLQEWTDYSGIEIYNGVIGWHDGSPYATNKWDMLLSMGRRVWGFANDDSHGPGGLGLGWNVAYVRHRTVAGVVDALQQGRFYASTGVHITDIRVDGNHIRLEAPDAERIVALRQVGKRLAVVDAPVIDIDVPDEAAYVRFECWGRGEKFAWTQPFFMDDGAR